MEEDPLILSPAAARRLKLLLGHGAVEMSAKLQDALPATENGVPEEGDSNAAGHLLWADILPFPVEVDAKELQKSGGALAASIVGGGSKSAGRDVLSEAALSPATMQQQGLSPGALVEVSNPDRPEVPLHLARVWPSNEVSDNAVALAPVLAHNLGLALHLSFLIHQSSSSPGSNPEKQEREGLPPPHRRVSIFKHTAQESADHQDSNGNKADSSNKKLETEAANVPVATEIHVSVLREPTREIVEAPKPSAHEMDPDGWGPMSSEKPSDGTERETEAIEAIQWHFLRSMRVVCQGDLLATHMPGVPPAAQVLGNLSIPVHVEGDSEGEEETHEHNEEGSCSSSAASTSSAVSASAAAQPLPIKAPRLIFFKIVQMLPHRPPAQKVDVRTTMVKLVGTCSGSLPVGLRGYLSPSPPPPGVLGWHPLAAANASQQGCQLEHIGTLMPAWRDLAGLLAAMMHPMAANTPLRTAILLHGPAGSGKRTAIAAAAAALGCHPVWLSCHDINVEGAPAGKIADGLRTAFEVASRYRPAILVLEQFEALAVKGGGPHEDAAASRLGSVLADCISIGMQRDSWQLKDRLFPEPVVLIACASSAEDVAAPLRRCFTHEIQAEAPGRGEREALLRSFMGGAGATLGSEDWEDLARHTAGLLPRDLRSLAAGACAAAALGALTPAEVLAGVAPAEGTEDATQGKKRNASLPEAIHAPALGPEQISLALSNTRERTATDIGAPKIPNVQWDDVGGLEDVKAAILDTVELPLRHPELFSGGLRRRSGVLLYGPPGTGKTLLAKAVATECAVNFLSVKGPELINMYVGESERLVRHVFARARRARPCVVFFDELDSLAPARGRGSDSGGVMDRVVSQLLAEIDSAQGGSGTDDVFIVGATNRPDLLDPALLRPGRLDKLLYVGVAGDATAQLKVIAALTRKFKMHEDVDLETLANACPPRLTGADLYALCSDAWMTALKRIVTAEEGDDNSKIVVQRGDFEAALAHLRPSLREEDIQHYEEIRDQYQGRKR